MFQHSQRGKKGKKLWKGRKGRKGMEGKVPKRVMEGNPWEKSRLHRLPLGKTYGKLRKVCG
jgi:hypothetical protein